MSYKLSKNEEYYIFLSSIEKESFMFQLTKMNNFRVIVNGKFTYYSFEAENLGYTWKTKEKRKGRRLKVGEFPVAWCTTQFGKLFYIYKIGQFEDV